MEKDLKLIKKKYGDSFLGNNESLRELYLQKNIKLKKKLRDSI